MTQIRGTNLSAPVVPFTDHDEFPTHYALYGRGGYRTVQTINERDLISEERREEGMLVWVIEDPSGKHLYQYLNLEWVIPSFDVEEERTPDIVKVNDVSDLDALEVNFAYVESKETIYVKKSNGEWKPLTSPGEGGETIIVPSDGIPIYTQRQYNALPEKPSDWISIPEEGELETEYGGGGYYVDILFNAIRSLQSEVARLKNSFKYGINSYTNTDTAMSRVSGENEEEPEEPLWATTEEDLSEITELNTSLEGGNIFVPQENVEILQHGIKINGTAGWTGLDAWQVTEDSKLYLYLTTSGQNIQIKFKNLEEEEDDITLDLRQLGIPRSDRYNILVIISRKVKVGELWASDNYIWMTVANWATGDTTNEGYFDPDTNKLTTRKTSLDSRFVFDTVYFTDTNIYKLAGYSKYQDFSGSVIPTTASDEDYKYRVAHITIRSVRNYTELKSIEDQLPKNELIYNEETGTLYIKTDTKVKAITGGGGSSVDPENPDSGMEKQEIIEWLAKNGIIVTDEGGELEISQIADITFVHQGTGKKFKFEADADGGLHSTELSDDHYEGAGGILSVNSFVPEEEEWGIRGFVGTLGDKKLKAMNKTIAVDKDHGLYSDRVKIGAIYAPNASLTTYGCSHAYIELENTSDQDFLLDGCYLHYATGISGTSPDIETYHLALEGVIPAGGTYLIRGKQYTNPGQANCFINVETFDKEWYIGNGELIDLTPKASNSYLLTYGLPECPWTTIMWRLNQDNATKAKAPFVYDPRYIDSVSIGKAVFNGNDSTNCTWNPYKTKDDINASIPYTAQTYDCIYKNTFELEPAKQGYQSCGTIDSSRLRGVTAGDFQYVKLDKDVIEFPKSDEVFPVAKYTPKASWQHKNVCTDKSKLDMEKPNMVTCSFGINIHTTRCFNWISAGEFDEYVWLRPAGASAWINRFESYKAGGNEKDSAVDMTRVEYESPELRAAAYERIRGTFPADGTHYTSHKCIVKARVSAPSQPTEYEYIVGRADKNMNPDPNHSSKIQRFTLYPTSYTPRIFQTTDQQGFHWVEYQAWAAAAEEVNKLINSTVATENIIPILVNTGDMTQNGTRINEWLDYYNGGACLFDHLEQMNVVGNNDLVGTDPEILGTGDDNGKSNGHYFHVFYCYEVDPDVNPIIYSSDGLQYKYIPSFYYFENTASSNVDSYRFVFLDTEITTINCRDWFKRVNQEGTPINVYTGWPITDSVSAEYDNGFKTIYSMIYQILDQARTNGQHIIAACHEMPFTVVTNANLKSGKKDADRSMNGTSLVGCHCNRLGSANEKSIYWLSRLLEYFQVKLMIGGHKHTYACTNPLREFYLYDGGTKNSLQDGPMTMESTLEHDDQVTWKATLGKTFAGALEVYEYGATSDTQEQFDTTKFPIMEVGDSVDLGVSVNSGTLWPYYGVRGDSYPKVTYLMCQATGFKLKSNKELPSSQQKFSYVIPKTDNSGTADSPNDNQLKPMFTEIVLSGNTYTAYLRRIEEITNGTKLFSQQAFSTKPAKFMYLKGNESDGTNEAMFGHWVNEKTPLIVL